MSVEKSFILNLHLTGGNKEYVEISLAVYEKDTEGWNGEEVILALRAQANTLRFDKETGDFERVSGSGGNDTVSGVRNIVSRIYDNFRHGEGLSHAYAWRMAVEPCGASAPFYLYDQSAEDTFANLADRSAKMLRKIRAKVADKNLHYKYTGDTLSQIVAALKLMGYEEIDPRPW
jgi:hypothetical protein